MKPQKNCSDRINFYFCSVIKTICHKGFSMLLAVLVMFSTLSVTVEKHFCNDVLVDVSVFSELEKCGMEGHAKEQETITKKPCCKDEVQFFEGQDELVKESSDDLTSLQKQILVAYAVSYYNYLKGSYETVIPHQYYSPPKLTQELHILHEVYLI